MKNLFLLLAMLFASSMTAQEVDEVNSLHALVDSLSSELTTVKAKEQKNCRDIALALQEIKTQSMVIDSLRVVISSNGERIENTASSLKTDIDNTRTSLAENAKHLLSDINAKSFIAGIIGLIAIIFVSLFFLYHKKISRKGDEAIKGFDERLSVIKREQEQLEDGMTNSHSKLLSVIENQLSLLASKTDSNQSEEPDHSLAIAVANEMARIQQNLNHMDSSVKGVSQLKNRAKAIMTTLNSKQYDIPELLGRTYHEEENMIVTMEYNEDLQEGNNRIKRVIKPQVSYAGKIIQHAEVVVEYNE